MLISFQNGQTSVILRVKLRQDTTGAKPGNGITGLTSTSTGLIIAAAGDTEATTTAYTSGASNVQTIAALGTYAAPSSGKCRFAEYDSTNHPGVYEIQLANARYAVSGARSLLVSITGVAGMADCDVVVPLLAMNPYDGIRAGLTGLPSAAVGSGANSFNFDASGWLKSDPQAWLGEAIPTPNQTGVPITDMGYVKGTASPATAGYVGIDWAQLTNHTATVALTNTTISPTQVISSVAGSVGGNVTGSVGSVAGNVGGNLVGTIGGYASGQDPGTLVSALTVAGKGWLVALKYIGAAVSGKSSGSGSGTETYDDYNGATAFVVTIDSNGNRTGVTYS